MLTTSPIGRCAFIRSVAGEGFGRKIGSRVHAAQGPGPESLIPGKIRLKQAPLRSVREQPYVTDQRFDIALTENPFPGRHISTFTTQNALDQVFVG